MNAVQGLASTAHARFNQGRKGAPSVGGHAAQATIPIVILKAKDGETLALARVVIHGARSRS